MSRLRSAAADPASFLVLLLLFIGAIGAWGVIRAAPLRGAGPSPTSVATGSPGATAAASPTPAGTLAEDGLRVFRMGPIPADHRYAFSGEGGDERLFLLDLTGGKVAVAAHFEGKGAFTERRRTEIAATPDGSLLLMLLRSDAPESRLYVIRPVTGEVSSFLIPSASMPRLRPDGTTLAVAHDELDPQRHGIWRFDTSNGIGARWTADPLSRAASDPIAWSADGRRLALLQDPDGQDRQVAVVGEGIDGVRVLGPGTGARWRGAELLVWDSRTPGAGVAAYDVDSGTARPAFPAEANVTIDRVEPRPGSTDIATVERSPGQRAKIVLHGTERAAAEFAIPDAGQLIAMWWSADGKRLYAWTNDNGTTTVTDVLTGTAVVQLCLRTRVTPPCS